MFDFMLGWSKASKCKKLMKKVRCRLNLLKNKRCCVVRQLRNDVQQLIKHGYYQKAFDRVDQIYKDECIIAVYELLAHFCEFLSLQLSYIRRNKDCPNDINEAISSLIFASARCGDLPELLRIRKLFRNRYGEHFEARALGLLPGNLVNFKIKENLSITKVPNEVKHKLVKELTTTKPLALEYTSHSQQEKINFPDDIKEFESPLMDGTDSDTDNGKDQRVFIFTSTTLFAGGCSRAMSMPCKRLNNECVDEHEHEDGLITRSYSFPVLPSAPHMHPKLPDYDELADKFSALKKQNLQKYKV